MLVLVTPKKKICISEKRNGVYRQIIITLPMLNGLLKMLPPYLSL